MRKTDHSPIPGRLVDVMKRDWDERARQDARWFINSLRVRQTDEEFDQTGRVEVERLVLADLDLLTSGRDPRLLSMLEIGCGAGRMTRHLAGIFGHVTGVDVSGEMIRQAKERLGGVENVSLLETSGVDFSHFPDESFDLALSAYVFQHVPSADVIASNLSDAWRVLKPGGTLRFQTNAISRAEFDRVEKDTWVGAAFTEDAIRDFARQHAAQLISIFGAETQYCWTTIRKIHSSRDLRPQAQSPLIIFFGHTYDAERQDIPRGGNRASLTLILTGMARADCNSVAVRIGDELIFPRYVGPIGQNFRPAIENRFGRDLSKFTQVEIGIPKGIAPVINTVSVVIDNRFTTPVVDVTFSETATGIPMICSVTNASDGGMDISSSGPKSRLQILVEGMLEESLHGEIAIETGTQIMLPEATGYLPEKRLVEIIVQLPAGLSGRVGMRVRIGDSWSEAFEITIKHAE